MKDAKQTNDRAGMAVGPGGAGPPRSFLERMLRVVTEIRPDEVPGALLFSLYAFLLLTAYACIKPVREALILQLKGGAEDKIYMAGATALLMLLGVPLYAKVAIAVPRNRLIVWVSSFFASHLVLFYVLGSLNSGSPALALGFYLWISVFNMMIVAQLWAFAADIYAEEEAGKRLFPLIGLGASLGAVAGSSLARASIERLGALALLLLGAAILLLSAWVAQLVHYRDVHRNGTPHAKPSTRRLGGSSSDAIRLVLRSRYLGFIALFSLVFTLVKTNGDYVLAKIVSETVKSASPHAAASAITDTIGVFYARFDFYIDLGSLIIQAFLVSRILKHRGFSFAFLVMPAIALLDAATMSTLPLMRLVAVGKVAESATDYSLNNTLRAMLWLPTSRRAKYLAKQTVDTFFVRMGDVSSAVLVFLGAHVLGLGVRSFGLCNVILTLIWLWFAHVILRERAKRLQHSEEKNRVTGQPGAADELPNQPLMIDGRRIE